MTTMIMSKPRIPLSLIQDLRCRQCEKFVSCGPVFVVPDESIICGRCQHLAKNIYRNTSYEAIASMFLYPCYNWEDRCATFLQWNDSLQHEPECSYDGCCSRFWVHPRAFCKGRREIPYGDIRLVPIPEYLLDHIKCAQCESYLSCEPVHIQTNGKNVCHRCYHANGIPPNSLRNISYETLSNIVIFPCVYRNRGCPTRLKFGSDLWEHESQCSYNQMFKKTVKASNQKEKGVIMTHSGHYYGTITPNSAPFAPPSEDTDFETNEKLLKSLKKQQERRFLRAEQIVTDGNSEDSVSTESSDKKNSYNKNSSGGSTPSGLEGTEQRPIHHQNYLPQLQYTDSGYFSGSNGRRPASENYTQNLLIAQVHQEDYKGNSPNISRSTSLIQSQKTTNGYSLDSPTLIPRISKIHDSPIFIPGPHPVFNFPQEPHVLQNVGVVRTESMNSNRELIQELKIKQTQMKHNAIKPKGDNAGVVRTESMNSNRDLIQELKIKHNATTPKGDSPYKECSNLEEILHVHDKIRE